MPAAPAELLPPSAPPALLEAPAWPALPAVSGLMFVVSLERHAARSAGKASRLSAWNRRRRMGLVCS
jgi:hypothetical protein